MVDPDIHLHCSSPFPKLPTVYPTSSSRKQRHLPPSAKSLVFRSFRNGTSDPFIEVQVPNQSTKIGCWTTPIQPPLPTFKKKTGCPPRKTNILKPKNGGGWKMFFLFNRVIFRFHVNFQGCISLLVFMKGFQNIGFFWTKASYKQINHTWSSCQRTFQPQESGGSLKRTPTQTGWHYQ